MSLVLQIPLRAELIDAEVASRLDSRQRAARDAAPYGKLLIDQYQERLPPDPAKGYSPFPGMANRTKK